jgi:hypothetical protein
MTTPRSKLALILAVMAGSAMMPSFAAAAPPIVFTDGPGAAGNLVALDARWQAVFEIDGRRVTRPAAEVVRWGNLKTPPADKSVVLLTGDGLLVAEPTRYGDGKLHVTSSIAGDVPLPRPAVRAIIWQTTADIARWERLLDTTNLPPDTDRLVLTNGDQLTGRVVALSAEHLTWRAPSGDIRLDLDRIAALGLASSPPGSAGGRAAPEAQPRNTTMRAIVGLSDGSRLIAQSLVIADENATLHLPPDVQLRVPAKQIALVQPLGGRATYLSDLTPQSYRHVPFFDIPWEYRRDRNVKGRWLESGTQHFAKGLGLHSASRLGYALDRPYQRFEAQVAIDDGAAPHGSVVFRVLTDDGDGQWRPRYASPIVRSGDKPVSVSVNLSGAKRLSLLVDYADLGDLSDHANWLEARLID